LRQTIRDFIPLLPLLWKAGLNGILTAPGFILVIVSPNELPRRKQRGIQYQTAPPLMGGDKGEGEQIFYHPHLTSPIKGEDYTVTLVRLRRACPPGGLKKETDECLNRYLFH